MADIRLEVWNRRLHYYLGRSYDTRIETPAGDTQTARTFDLMRQLNLRGEVEWPASQPVGHIDFSVSRPDGSSQVRVDLYAKRAYVKEFQNGHFHAFQIFHTFSGSRFNQPASRRDWIMTSVWVFAMDALAAGLIVMVLGSYYMWWRLKKLKTLGGAVLAAGFAISVAFATGVL